MIFYETEKRFDFFAAFFNSVLKAEWRRTRVEFSAEPWGSLMVFLFEAGQALQDGNHDLFDAAPGAGKLKVFRIGKGLLRRTHLEPPHLQGSFKTDGKGSGKHGSNEQEDGELKFPGPVIISLFPGPVDADHGLRQNS
jgi:hypothetical protein